jgi:hypothetical protein
MAKPTQGSVTSRPVNMTGQPKQGPSKDMAPAPGSVTPKAWVPGSGLSNEPKIEPTQGPNKAFSEGKSNK